MSLSVSEAPHQKSTADSYQRQKLLFISLSYFFVIAANTLFKDLRDSIFISVVGREWVWKIKPLAMIILIPAILFYSFLVDRIRRYQLLYFYAFFYGVVGLIFAYYLGDPVIGIANTDAAPNRLFGWLFYFFIEGFTPFVVSVFWAFANSVFGPQEAKNSYSFMISCSKVGGMIAAGFGWALFTFRPGASYVSDFHVVSHQLLVGVASLFILTIPLVIYLLMKYVPGSYMHGYEAVYQLEKTRKKEKVSSKTGVFSGLALLVRWPYIFGIFSMVFFYEISHTVFSYLRLGFVEKASADISEISYYLFQQAFFMHAVGLVVSYVGTRALLSRLGERYCLLLIPTSVMVLFFYFLTSASTNAVLITFILLRAFNYAFFKPVIESLYIPTLKDVKFKSKSWIDAFGTKLAKTSGSAFNGIVELSSPALFFPLHVGFFAVIAAVWFCVAYVLGKRFTWAVEHNEVIGVEKKADGSLDDSASYEDE